MKPAILFTSAILVLCSAPAAAQVRVTAIDPTECFAVSSDGEFLPDSVSRMQLTIADGDSLVAIWDPAVTIGSFGMEEDGGMDIWWATGVLTSPLTIGGEQPGAENVERIKLSAFQPGLKFRVLLADAANPDEATWACVRLFEIGRD